MSRCKNCSYILTLLPKRRKYKCAKCGKLFLQKEIDLTEFLRWNKWQRELDNGNIQQEFKLRRIRNLKPRKRLEPEVKRKRLRGYSFAYYYKNRDKILQDKKEYRKRTKESANVWRRSYRHNLIDKTRILGRIHYYRNQQKRLAQKELKVNGVGVAKQFLL